MQSYSAKDNNTVQQSLFKKKFFPVDNGSPDADLAKVKWNSFRHSD